MTFNFLSLKISSGIMFIILIAIIVLLFLAPTYIHSHNQMAKNLLYGAAFSALALFVIAIMMACNCYPQNMDALTIEDKFCAGTFVILSLGTLLLIAIVILSFYALSFIEDVDNNVHVARILTIVAGALAAYLLIGPLIHIFYKFITFNMHVDCVLGIDNEPVVGDCMAQSGCMASPMMTKPRLSKYKKMYNEF